MKNDIKKKVDTNATGNKRIVLKKWENELIDLMNKGTNPVFSKVPGKFFMKHFFKVKVQHILT